MHKRTVIYRGSLKSCNYSCSYCPFAKHRAQPTELERDRQNFARFCGSVAGRAEDFSIGAVFLTPYGEASIYPWYWEGLSGLAKLSGIDRVGMQTNLSFPVEECLKRFDAFGGKREKLCIWATFHPEMTTVEAFVSNCHRLAGKHVSVCAGAVGVPGNIPVLKEVRAKLSPAIYLWINRMDGLRRNYSAEEAEAFVQIDPFFPYELENPEAAVQMCGDRCFVEADGGLRTCNISRNKNVNWYDGQEEDLWKAVCGRKRCSCYLAYGGRRDFALRKVFGEYPVYRIPRTFRAVFFDLDGTLIPADRRGAGTAVNRQEKGLPAFVRAKLSALREGCPIFLATSMPEEAVKKRLRDDMELFQGIIFASGAYLRLKGENGEKTKLYPVDTARLPEIIEFGEKAKANCMVSRSRGTAYKITLVKGRHSFWKKEECDRLAEILRGSSCRFFTEHSCLEIIAEGRDKGAGIEEMCGWLAIPVEDVLAAGNDEEDAAMERVCGAYLSLHPDLELYREKVYKKRMEGKIWR